jgi:hypothetical protein
MYTTSLLQERGQEKSFKLRYMWLRAVRCPQVRDLCDVVWVGLLKPVREGLNTKQNIKCLHRMEDFP